MVSVQMQLIYTKGGMHVLFRACPFNKRKQPQQIYPVTYNFRGNKSSILFDCANYP